MIYGIVPRPASKNKDPKEENVGPQYPAQQRDIERQKHRYKTDSNRWRWEHSDKSVNY